MIEIIGWLGAILFCFCAAPQSIKSYKDGHSQGLSHYFLWMWFLGEVFSVAYIWDKDALPILTNYIFNILFLLVILKYKYFPRKDEKV